MSRPRSHSRSFWRNCQANAAVEFAIVLPFLLLLIAGTVDLGIGFREKVQLQSALNSGMQHVMQTQGTDTATSRKVIAYSLGPKSAAEIDLIDFCRCGSKTLQCTASCGSTLRHFVSGSVSLPYESAIFGTQSTIGANFELYVGEVK